MVRSIANSSSWSIRGTSGASKIEHIICSDNKDEAVKYAFSDALPHESLEQATALQVANYKSLKTCAQADSVIKEHQEIISKLGVNGTPSFLFGAKPIIQ